MPPKIVMPPEDRYARQIRFAPLGNQGQDELARSTVAVVGCGALGTVAAAALARAGTGRLRLIDRDAVEWTNLQRQWLYDEADAADGALKAPAAVAKLRRANSSIAYEALVDDMDAFNVEDLLENVQLVVDATDNFETRFLINDYCVRERIPWVFGAAVGSYGLSFPILPGAGPCLRCVYPEPPKGVQPTCDTAGVLNSITSLVGSWQVALATRILSGHSQDLPLRLTTFDAWRCNTRQVGIERHLDCPCCVHRHFVHLDGQRRAPVSLCGRDAVQIHERQGKLDLADLELSLAGLGPTRRNEFALRFSLQDENRPLEFTFFPDGRAIIKGTTDPALARSLYARFVGK